jgi:hypothetical protein
MSSSSVKFVVFLTVIAFLAMEQRMNTKFSFKLGKTPTEIYEMLQLSMVMKLEIVAMYLLCFNHLKTSMKIFRMIQEAGVLEPLEMQTQLQMSMKW